MGTLKKKLTSGHKTPWRHELQRCHKVSLDKLTVLNIDSGWSTGEVLLSTWHQVTQRAQPDMYPPHGAQVGDGRVMGGFRISSLQQ